MPHNFGRAVPDGTMERALLRAWSVHGCCDCGVFVRVVLGLRRWQRVSIATETVSLGWFPHRASAW